MKRLPARILVLIILVFFLGSCASTSPSAQRILRDKEQQFSGAIGTTVEELVAILGYPTRTTKDPDGTIRVVYPAGVAFGYRGFFISVMLTADANTHRVYSVRAFFGQ